jgi:hypothetical protein
MTAFAVRVSMCTLYKANNRDYGSWNKPEMDIFRVVTNSQAIIAVLNMVVFEQHV